VTLPAFDDFFAALHGTAPLPWQRRAAERLARRETFVVTVPTGLGKSALVDAAVWAAAHGAWRRIAFVVDRRIVVDAVHQRALHIRDRLADDPRLTPLAAALGEMQVVRLRGGVFGDDDWVLYPERLTVALTTVDQLGSRLMFRGYGVAPRRWPMHAGFFAHDTLVVVDEAHLSQPWLQTLSALQDHGARVAVVPMTATPGALQGERIALEADDTALPAVQRRLGTTKPAELIDAPANEGEFAAVAADQVQRLLAQPQARRLALVLNRVATARRCFTLLQRRGIRCELLTGRVRPAERDARLEELLPLVRAGRTRTPHAEPLVIVATQTIEVGADFDFDGLVTEAAPLSALRQRFGRVDRLGELGRAAGVVLLRQVSNDRADAVYGNALADALSWLREQAGQTGGVVDFGLAAMNERLARSPAPAEARVHAASLLPAHLQMLAQTGPFAPQIDLGAWLHGPSPRAPDVTLVWRDDLDAGQPAGWAAAVQLLPPMLREGLPMPAAAVRRWLTGARVGDEWSDAGSAADDARPDESPEGRAVLRWRGPDECEVIAARDIRPGDTLVLPSSYGGCDAWGWAPEAAEAVSDLADACAAERIEAGASRRAVLRLCDGHWPALGAAADRLRGLVARLLELQQLSTEGDEDLGDEIEATAAALRESVFRSGHPLAPLLRDAAIEPHPAGLVLRGAGVEELEGVVETGRAVPLDVHHADVARWAERLTPGDARQAAIVEAARVHDAGKAEPRMQALLHGSALRAAAGPVLAKSALRRRVEQTAAWRASGMPRGFRHEFASLERVAVTDPLVRHLVATHHGLGRPWLPPCADPAAEGAGHAALGSGWQAHWHAACAAYGPYELARMEWLLRAADARASMEEASDGDA